MNNPKEIKSVLDPVMVAKFYLGTPNKNVRGKLWYNSPFRNEKTPSFMVDERSFHDFGEDWDGDVISFVERYYSTDFLNAMKILTSDFHLPEDEEFSKEMKDYIKKQKDEERRIVQAIEDWFRTTFNSLCNKLHNLNKKIPKLKDFKLAEAYMMQVKLEYLIEEFMNANDEEKIELYRSREEIQKCGDFKIE